MQSSLSTQTLSAYAHVKRVAVHFSIVSTLFILFLSANAHAKQIDFQTVSLGDQIQFNYEWQDINKEVQTLSFQLSKKSIYSDFRHFKALRPSLLKMHSEKQLKKAISKLNPREGRVTLLPSTDNVEFKITSRSEEWANQTVTLLNKVHRDSLKEYLKQEYYTEFNPIGFNEPGDSLTFKPDHARFIEESGQSTKPLIDALKAKLPNVTARKMAEFLLGWIQTIPYDEMDNRTTSNGAGFAPPMQLLRFNKGDCDSKVTLFAHLMKELYPRLRMAIVFLPNHALLAMNISVLDEDETIEFDGLQFVLTEPVGPALIEFAKVAPSSMRYIDSGMYSLELLF